ncbi:hypothetical protein [Niabella hirudinis]|uniref:hypothetical protein n=1 Tax=Niabella hirudinis TaxID=1285929 RepID=UPI003EB901E9
MKNKNAKDPFETLGWNHIMVTDPYQVFAISFDFADIGAFRKTIRQVLLSAAGNKVHKKSEPTHVLCMFRAIRSVMLAAHRLYRQGNTCVLQIEPGQFAQKRLYARPDGRWAAWAYLPKNLSTKEYRDPYRVFRHFFKYQTLAQWQQSMAQMLDYALASNTGHEDLNLLKLYLHLTRLMEAAHLIDVREVTHVGGLLKPAAIAQRR